ncbi:MAG: alanine racemase [bacterium]
MKRPTTWVEIKKSSLLSNARYFRKLVGLNTQIMAVVKSNAYGHGIRQAVQALFGSVDWFGVANLEEAFTVRKYDKKTPILVLSYFAESNISDIAKSNIHLPLTSLEHTKTLINASNKCKKKINCHIKFDVGTSRVGFFEKDIKSLASLLKTSRYLNIAGIFSHFADSENSNQAFTVKQHLLFQKIIKKTEQELGKIKYHHIACTASTVSDQRFRYNLVRIGIGLYGLWPSDFIKNNHNTLTPVLSWKTKVLDIKKLTPGTSIGYARTCKIKKHKIIAILPMGYYEGYNRGLSNISRVLVKGQSAGILGAICMNLMMIDISNIRGVVRGDQVTLIGNQGRGLISADELANKSKTINYEIVTRINPLLPRILV